MLNTIPIAPGKLYGCLEALYRLRYPAYLAGPPGIGKSAVVRQFAHDRHVQGLAEAKPTDWWNNDKRKFSPDSPLVYRSDYEPEMSEGRRPSLQSYDRQEAQANIPLSWQSGSEQELRWLALSICRTEPDLFNAQTPVTVVYRATTPYRRGGFLYVEREGEHLTSRRLMSLCDLAFRLNPCIGMQWIKIWSGRMQRAAMRILVKVDPPSAHEKAEAFLTLVDWLDDKLHDPEKRMRFGLSPLPEDRAGKHCNR